VGSDFAAGKKSEARSLVGFQRHSTLTRGKITPIRRTPLNCSLAASTRSTMATAMLFAPLLTSKQFTWRQNDLLIGFGP